MIDRAAVQAVIQHIFGQPGVLGVDRKSRISQAP